jgi:hypothetical protein
MPTLEPSPAGLTISGRPSSAMMLSAVVRAAHHAPAWRREARGGEQPLAAQLVHGQRRAEHAAAGVGHAERLERALHEAVLAAAAVQRQPGAVEARPAEQRTGSLHRVDGMRIDAAANERGKYRLAADQRNLALGRLAAHQHGDPPEIPRVGDAHAAHGAVRWT